MLGLVQNTDTWTHRESPSTETLKTSLSFDPMVHWSMHRSGPVCTSNLLPALNTLTEKGPYILITGRYPLFSPQGIICSKILLEQVDFSLLILCSTSSLISIHEIKISFEKKAFYQWMNVYQLCIWNYWRCVKK